MKVKDLKEGMILMPVLNRWTRIRMAFKVVFQTDEEENSYWSVSCDGFSRSASPNDSLAIYIGTERADFFMNGVKKHHILFVDGKVARVDGYEFRWIEPASN